jgi:hypothetical protein
LELGLLDLQTKDEKTRVVKKVKVTNNQVIENERRLSRFIKKKVYALINFCCGAPHGAS